MHICPTDAQNPDRCGLNPPARDRGYLPTDFHAFAQENAEQAVREMLQHFSKDRGLQEIDTVTASDIMDDGSPIRLAVTIDRRDGSAIFDFEGAGL